MKHQPIGCRELTPEQTQAVLQERARLLARPPALEASTSEVLELLVFRLGQEPYAIETQFVQKVFRPAEISPVPRSAAFLKGVTNLHGEVLAVMDLSTFLGRTSDSHQAEWILVFGVDRAEFGVFADAVVEVVMLREEEIFSAQQGLPHVPTDWIRGVTAEALFVLDGEKILNDPRLVIDEL